jgi:hypothetical protein
MSVNTIESPDAQPIAQKQNSELIYRLEDRPPLPQTLFAACQHLLAMFVAVITPALLICQALGLPGAAPEPKKPNRDAANQARSTPPATPVKAILRDKFISCQSESKFGGRA